jgi:hypothetical protein|tara:strand:+ start:172 stop:387 length:216 start_codon:yes stop_codon:yes gene_type:complete
MWNIFKNDNEWNEKTVVGFIAFLIMCAIMVADLVTGLVGKDLIVNEFLYDSFTLIVLGCFGIAGIEKFAKK